MNMFIMSCTHLGLTRSKTSAQNSILQTIKRLRDNHWRAKNINVKMQEGLYRPSAKLHETSSRRAQAWSVLNGIAQNYLPPTRFIPERAEPHQVIYLRNLQQQSSNMLIAIIWTHNNHNPISNGHQNGTTWAIRHTRYNPPYNLLPSPCE